MGIPGLTAIGRFSYAAGTAGTVTVASGLVVVRFSAASIAGGSMTIAAGGPNQSASPSAGSSIPIPAGIPFAVEWAPGLSPLGGGTVLTFTSTDAYYVEFSAAKVGA